MSVDKKVINKSCQCKRVKCERHGDCEKCRAHHHSSKRKPLTSCEKMSAVGGKETEIKE